MLNDLETTLARIGPRLRTLRQRRGITLGQLAEATGISVSTLSRLESGQRRATLELLLPLARSHRIPLDELVDAPEVGDPRVRPRPQKRHGMTFLPLSRSAGGMQAYKLLIPAGNHTQERRQQVHDGYDWMYVLSGRVHLLLGEHDLVLTAGGVAEFDTRTPHWYGNPGPGPAEVLTLFGPQGERLHVRAQPASREKSPKT